MVPVPFGPPASHAPGSGEGATCGHVPHSGCGAASPGQERAFFDSLPPGHMVRTLMEEHEHIRLQLDRLETATRAIAGGGGAGNGDQPHLESALDAGRKLAGAEPHHRREEEVLFPALAKRGLHGPPEVMTAEHVELRRLKAEVVSESEACLAGRQARREPLTRAALALVAMLRAHIVKENNVLYPMALGLIRDDGTWSELRARADAIGYCCHVLHAR